LFRDGCWTKRSDGIDFRKGIVGASLRTPKSNIGFAITFRKIDVPAGIVRIHMFLAVIRKDNELKLRFDEYLLLATERV
jgi:hypothetical protein